MKEILFEDLKKADELAKVRFRWISDNDMICTASVRDALYNVRQKPKEYILQKSKKYLLTEKGLKFAEANLGKIKKFDHVRFAGSDYRKEEVIIKKNTIVQPKHILAFKSLGIKQIKVKRRINILFFSTGNEISDKDNIPNWMVRNSNTHYIKWRISKKFPLNKKTKYGDFLLCDREFYQLPS